MTYPQPLTYAAWRRIKSAARHRNYLERLQEADDVSVDAWLAAVRRDEATDPYARHARRKCSAIEREPGSADVCLKHWERETGPCSPPAGGGRCREQHPHGRREPSW